MGDGEKAPLRLQFNPKVRLEFHGSTITSDAGLLAFRELDDALDLTGIASNYLQESRTGRNILHHLVPLQTVDLQWVKTVAWPATTTPMTQCAFPKTLLCESSLLVQAQTITPPAPARWAGLRRRP